ncbi:GH1 family beta-glucosidase [Spirilliplanes yamanashiensis]|uniref:Beta-glucosidase n=1 Tax=Spirilliplanes yamanashiensis TaxID=42233 RepID=A0A8J4DKI8_9ACTN|nr:GH1 family beta-glucosidase [Spirilliplanes yamanashiensis]MDP9818135.1 beta-glucosidase [Spirilliplanes yamanashiensis]GIJ04946.1 beta-glucosidase [Spirilliplanes yamanashiensis]
MSTEPSFPAGFRWGAATAAYQIEGAVTEDGRGASVWDTFCAQPGRIRDGSSGAVACDHYHRYAEDAALLAGLGAGAYRFSVAWPRIQPTGRGAANPAGLAFYDRLVDTLLGHGIDPAATLFHWDLPQALQDRGGWLDRDTAYRFAEYADLVGRALGDRVRLWITLNEPVVHTMLGYGLGQHAPGETLLLGCFPAAHHQLLGHGLATAALRARTASPVAITNNYTPVWPGGGSAADAATVVAYDALHNRTFTDPVLGLGYPAEAPLDLSVVRDGDLETIAAPIDALGVNYYNPTAVRAPVAPGGLPFEIVPVTGYPRTGFDWPVVPDGLRDLLVGLRDRYRDALPPLYVTENGCAYPDEVGPDGRCDDPERVAYLDAHVRAVGAAIAAGVDVRGYFVWSLLDNFEWAEGYTQRFGLVHVDFATGTRTPKTSYGWYRDLIAGQSAPSAAAS